MADSDEDLAVRCQGDPGAFRELFRRYQRRLYHYAKGMLGSSEDAEDVTQDTFVRVFKFAHRFDRGRRFSTWLYTIAANQCRNRLRRRRPALSLDDQDVPEPKDDSSPGPIEVYEASRVKEMVDAAIEELPLLYREVLHLRYLEGMAYKEIAGTLRVSVSAVETRIFRGKKLLRTHLAGLSGLLAEAKQ